MPETREFDLGDILTVITGRMMSPRRYDGFSEFMTFLLDQGQDEIPPMAIWFMAENVKPRLVKQLPQFAELDTSSLTKENWQEWLDAQIKTYGKTINVTQILGAEAV